VNLLIPLMVIVPILCALFLNLLHKKDRTIKTIAILLALILPALPLLANYGLHYFGGYAPLIENPTLSNNLPSLITGTALNTFHPAITYSFQSAQKIFVFILGLGGGGPTIWSLWIHDVHGNRRSNCHTLNR